MSANLYGIGRILKMRRVLNQCHTQLFRAALKETTSLLNTDVKQIDRVDNELNKRHHSHLALLVKARNRKFP